MQPVDIDTGALHFHPHQNRHQRHLDVFHQMIQLNLFKTGHQFIFCH